MRGESTDVLDVLFSSRTRLKILKLLARLQEVNITRLTSMLGLNHKVVREHIEELKRWNIVEERAFGRIKIVRLNERNPYVVKLLKFMSEMSVEQSFEKFSHPPSSPQPQRPQA